MLDLNVMKLFPFYTKFSRPTDNYYDEEQICIILGFYKVPIVFLSWNLLEYVSQLRIL